MGAVYPVHGIMPRIHGVPRARPRSRYPLEPSLHVIAIDTSDVGGVVADGARRPVCVDTENGREGRGRRGEGGAGSTARTIMHTQKTEH